MNWASEIINKFANPFREQVLSSPVVYRTKDGVERRILATSWAESGFSGLQQIGFDNISLNRFHSAFTVLKEQLYFEFDVHFPKGKWRFFSVLEGQQESDQWQNFPVLEGQQESDQWQFFPEIALTERLFNEPKVGDEIIEEDGTVHTVSQYGTEPQWFYAADNPCKNTIIINTMRLRGHE